MKKFNWTQAIISSQAENLQILKHTRLNQCCDNPDIQTGWRQGSFPRIGRYIECVNCKADVVADSNEAAVITWNYSVRNEKMIDGYYDYPVELPCMELMSG